MSYAPLRGVEEKQVTKLELRADPGNVGFLTGPAWFESIESLIGASKVAVQGVQPYSASVDGFLSGGDATGTSSMFVIASCLTYVATFLISNP